MHSALGASQFTGEERATVLTRTARALVLHRVPVETVLELVAAWNAKHNSPPLSEELAIEIVLDIDRGERRRREGAR